MRPSARIGRREVVAPSRRLGGQSGFATLQYVGAVLVAAALAVVVLPFASPASAQLADRFYCAVTSVTHFPSGGERCRTEGGTPGDPTGPGGTPTVGPGDPTGDPDDPDDPADPEGDPGGNPDDPDDPECKDRKPSSGPLDPDEPTLVTIGCRELYVPKGCEAEWSAYQEATPGREREEAAGPLGDCVRTKYDSMEPTCIVNATTEIDREEIQILFIRISKSDSLLVEKLGDGRVRAHLLKGAELGAGPSGKIANISFNVAGITGYEDDKTYEFADTQAAQDWLNWYKDLRRTSESIPSMSQAAQPPPQCPGCPRNPVLTKEVERAVAHLKELKENEPGYHELANAKTSTQKVTVEGGVSLPIASGGKKGGVEVAGTPGIEGSYTGEIQVEDRRWSDGSQTASYKSSDAGGFLIGMKLGGQGKKKPEKEGDKPGDVGGGSGGFNWGKDWAGTTQTSVTWGPDGKLSKLIFTMDEQSMQTLHKAGIDLNVALPYGFGASFGYSEEKKEGTASATEMILDFNQYPELREQLGPTIDSMFPRDEDGRLDRGDVEVDFEDDAEQQAVHDVVKDKSNVRRLDYGVKEDTTAFTQGIDLAGVDLFKSTYTHVESSKDLNESSFEIKDVNGDRKTVRPAPKCKAEAFEAPTGYYEGGWSNPPTPYPVP